MLEMLQSFASRGRSLNDKGEQDFLAPFSLAIHLESLQLSYEGNDSVNWNRGLHWNEIVWLYCCEAQPCKSFKFFQTPGTFASSWYHCMKLQVEQGASFPDIFVFFLFGLAPKVFRGQRQIATSLTTRACVKVLRFRYRAIMPEGRILSANTFRLPARLLQLLKPVS